MTARDDVRLNLSYVLHESSRSIAVERELRRVWRFQTTLRRLTANAVIVDPQRGETLRRERALVLTPGTGSALERVAAAGEVFIVTARLGAHPLLLPAIRSALGGRTPPRCTVWALDTAPAGAYQEIPLFRGLARVAAYPNGAIGRAGWPEHAYVYAALVVRPDGSLMLDARPLGSDADPPPEPAAVIDAAIPLLEAAIRDHVGQWGCHQALWSRPAEEELPELRP